MAVAVYLRVSTEEQRERQSIETQREFAERFCSLHSLSVFKVYADEGVSGTVALDRREEGSQILAAARAGKFNQLLLYRLDRLGRETRLILNAVDELEQLGVRVRSMTEEFDTGSATGRLMLTLLSGFASHERDVIRERSVAGTRRLAEAGTWMGGIVPYGYRKEGEKKNARLVVAEEPIPDAGMSEADVVRLIYRMSAVERKSCHVIADRLNELKLPCAYVRDDRLMLRGKRRQRTSGLWRPGRVRNLIISTTYKGIHEYGKRSKKRDRDIIVRPVPALVTEKTWTSAQTTLKANFSNARRNTRARYLLRGLIKCARCGLTFCGRSQISPAGKVDSYYNCTGYTQARGLYGTKGQRCPSKAVRGDHLEEQVWVDVQSFLRNPSTVLEQLQAKLESDATGDGKFESRFKRLAQLTRQKEAERTRVIGLFRKGRIDEKVLDEQMTDIDEEEAALQAQVDELRGRVATAKTVRSTLDSTEALLTRLRTRLDSPVSWECKRELIEVLVAGVRVEPVETDEGKQNRITVTYRFSDPGVPMELVLPQVYSSGSVVRLPAKIETVGDHLRQKRFKSRLYGHQLADRLGVTAFSIQNWEMNRTVPKPRYWPGIIEFLGFDPRPEGKNWAEKLFIARTAQGLSQKQAALCMKVDPTTLARWERGEREPIGAFEIRARKFLAEGQSRSAGHLAAQEIELAS